MWPPFTFIGKKCLCPGITGKRSRKTSFTPHTPGNNPYLVNYKVAREGEVPAPTGLRATENRAFEANIKQNHPDFSFLTSEHNDGHEEKLLSGWGYSPGSSIHRPEKRLWRKWKFEYTGNARIPIWVVRVPKDIIWGHGGLWSDNSVAMFGALFRMEFPLGPGGIMAVPKPRTAPKSPDLQ